VVVLAKGSVAEIDAEAEQATTEQIARCAGEWWSEITFCAL
jgi:hypothetical protein